MGATGMSTASNGILAFGLSIAFAVSIISAKAGNQHDWNCPGGAKLHLGVVKEMDEKKQEDKVVYYIGIDHADDLPQLTWKYRGGVYVPYVNGKLCKDEVNEQQ
jgi:hypothetical protein